MIDVDKAVAEQSIADEEFVNSLNARISEMGSIRESLDEDPELSPTSSFQDASDTELAQQFNERLGEVSSSNQEIREQLTGVDMAPFLGTIPFACSSHIFQGFKRILHFIVFHLTRSHS